MRQEDHAERARYRRRSGPAAALRSEAMRDRPGFSAELHRRLLERLEACPGRRRRLAAVEPALADDSSGRPRPGRWLVTASLGGLAVLASLSMVGRFRPGVEPAARALREPAAVAVADELPAESGTAAVPVTAEVGIDRLPMFDEIGDGVVESVTTLAVSLLEVPDLTMLADLGASVAEGDQAGR